MISDDVKRIDLLFVKEFSRYRVYVPNKGHTLIDPTLIRHNFVAINPFVLSKIAK